MPHHIMLTSLMSQPPLTRPSTRDPRYTAPAVAVINTYFDSFFPRAASIGAALRAQNGTDRLRWMTQSYLVSLFLDCPPGIGLNCPNGAAKDAFKAAAAAGDITWQAFPQ